MSSGAAQPSSPGQRLPPDLHRRVNSIALAYCGVHEIFQLALAAHEIGEFDGLFCSMVDRPGKMGSWIARLARIPSARPLGLDQLPAEKIAEYPWPVMASRLLLRIVRGRQTDHWHSTRWFDGRSAKWLSGREARLFVGNETCSQQSLAVARSKGMATVLDCPGIPWSFLDRQADLAAAELGLQPPKRSNRPAMIRKKSAERSMADVILACSDFHKEIMVREGYAPAEKIHALPLWTDPGYWAAGCGQSSKPQGSSAKLRLLYVGAVSVKKGVPYLLKAFDGLANQCDLTLAGSVTPEMSAILPRHSGFTLLPYVPKEQLRALYHSHDVLVMPTLGDSFGFVLMEAMAAGLPVIASAHSGAPVPDPFWRVPARDALAITERARHYLSNRQALARDSDVAREFASQFRPERYRREAGKLFRQLLGGK